MNEFFFPFKRLNLTWQPKATLVLQQAQQLHNGRAVSRVCGQHKTNLDGESLLLVGNQL